MKNRMLHKSIFAFAAFCLVTNATVARAGSYSFLATTAQGANDCSTAENACDNLGTALTNTSDGGVIKCISTGVTAGFVTIQKSVTIDCATVGYTAGQITVAAPGKQVKILGLTINGAGGGNPILTIGSASSVFVEHVRIGNPDFSVGGECIRDVRQGPAKLFLNDVSLYDCGNIGLLVVPQGSGNIAVALNRVTSYNNNYGIAVGNRGRIMIDSSTFSGNATAGVEADAGAFIGLDNSLLTNNGVGVLASGTIAISNSNINSNTTAISGATQSFGNNRIFANNSPGTAPTPAGAVSNEAGQR